MKKLTITKIKKALKEYQTAFDLVSKNYELKPESTFEYLTDRNMEFGLCFYFSETLDIDKHLVARYFKIDGSSFINRTPNSYNTYNLNPNEGLKARIEFLKEFIKQNETTTNLSKLH